MIAVLNCKNQDQVSLDSMSSTAPDTQSLKSLDPVSPTGQDSQNSSVPDSKGSPYFDVSLMTSPDSAQLHAESMNEGRSPTNSESKTDSVAGLAGKDFLLSNKNMLDMFELTSKKKNIYTYINFSR